VDLTAAFDSLDRDALWKAMKGIGTPLQILDLLRVLHSEGEGRELAVFVISHHSGVRQGYVLAPKLFCTAIDWMAVQNRFGAEKHAT